MDLSAFDNADGIRNGTYVNFTCLEFTVKTYDIVLTTKMPLCSCAIIVNLVAIVFIFFAKRHTDFLYRLMVYLMITDILQALAIIFISLPVYMIPHDGVVHVRSEGGCVASGYFSMSTMWMGNIVFFWISLHLAYRGWCLYRHVDRRGDQDNKMEGLKLKGIRGSRTECPIKEIVSVLFLFVAPFAIASIPFAVDGGSYGLSGLWCWIKAFNAGCGDLDSRDRLLILLLLFFYGPLMIIVLLAVVFVMIAFCCYCRGEVRKIDKDREKKERYIKEILILLPLPLVYWTACMFLLINRIHTTIHDDDNNRPFEPLWIVHAIADSLRSMLPALAFLLHPCVWKDRAICLSKRSNRLSETDKTGTGSSQESLVIAPPGDRNKGYYGSCNASDTHSVFDTSNNY